MTEREFLERVELELRIAARHLTHVRQPNRLVCVSSECLRCRIIALADEAADRQMQVAA